MKNTKLIKDLNNALSLELRAIILYSHYSAYVQGIHRIHLSAHFNNEAAESIGHANIVRSAIVKLGGVAVTERNSLKIKHTKNINQFLKKTKNDFERFFNIKIEYLENRNTDDLSLSNKYNGSKIFLAYYYKGVRLIDNF